MYLSVPTFRIRKIKKISLEAFSLRFTFRCNQSLTDMARNLLRKKTQWKYSCQADHLTLVGGGGGGAWAGDFENKISCKRLLEESNCM